MLQQGQVFKLRGGDGRDVWAFRYRLGGRGSRRVQRGGFASERDASEALERALERVRRERGCGSALTLGELVDVYLAQHDGEPETVEKLRWLLRKPVKAFGARRLPELRCGTGRRDVRGPPTNPPVSDSFRRGSKSESSRKSSIGEHAGSHANSRDTKSPLLRGISRALFRTRTGDPLLTMRSKRQRVATSGNGSGLDQAIFVPSESRTFATGCAPSVP